MTTDLQHLELDSLACELEAIAAVLRRPDSDSSHRHEVHDVVPHLERACVAMASCVESVAYMASQHALATAPSPPAARAVAWRLHSLAARLRAAQPAAAAATQVAAGLAAFAQQDPQAT
jgi:hypothetical protein